MSSTRNLLLVPLGLALIVVVPEEALASVSMKLTCVPSTPTPGQIASRSAGTVIFVEVELENDSCSGEAVNYGSVQVGIVGNSNDTLGGLGIFGPFKRPIAGTIEAGTCPTFQCTAPPSSVGNFCNFDSDCDSFPANGDGVCANAPVPGTDSFRIPVTALPASLEGTVAQVAVSLKIDDGRRLVRTCDVEVLP